MRSEVFLNVCFTAGAEQKSHHRSLSSVNGLENIPDQMFDFHPLLVICVAAVQSRPRVNGNRRV